MSVILSNASCLHTIGEIISRFERKGFQLKGLKLYQTPKSVAEEHYKDLASKPFYKDLVSARNTSIRLLVTPYHLTVH